jgi:hypothetical protein
MMSRSISQTTAAISQITTEITTTVMIKLKAPRTLLTSSQLKAGTPRRILPPVKPWEDTTRPYTLVMADEDTVLDEAMDNLKEAGQRIRATQSLMRSQGMTDGENHRDLLTRLSTALAMTEAAYLEARRRRDL